MIADIYILIRISENSNVFRSYSLKNALLQIFPFMISVLQITTCFRAKRFQDQLKFAEFKGECLHFGAWGCRCQCLSQYSISWNLRHTHQRCSHQVMETNCASKKQSQRDPPQCISVAAVFPAASAASELCTPVDFTIRLFLLSKAPRDVLFTQLCFLVISCVNE